MFETLLALITSAAGFALGKWWEQYVQKKKQIELDLWKLRVAEVEARLREFLWPIYLRLQRDNVVWEKILQRESHDPEQKKVAHQIETDVIIPNHAEIISLIERGMHYVRSDAELERALLAYVRHIDVYRSIRAAGITDKDPVAFGEPYPDGFFAVVSARVQELQAKYDAILSENIEA